MATYQVESLLLARKMPALLVNVKIDCQEKLDLFKATLADLRGLFDECHIKIRGTMASHCIEYAKRQFEGTAKFYQELQETDWVAASLVMLGQVGSRSVFLYCEDHKLVESQQRLKQVLDVFDGCELDYLCYSFFQASQLGVRNILPLNPRRHISVREFDLTEQNLRLLGKISPKYCTYSLLSVASVDYLVALLQLENKKYKVYSHFIARLLIKLFPFPRYRKVFDRINSAMAGLNARLCASPPSSPFNMEKFWFEFSPRGKAWKFGVLDRELFANYDDDNGAYGESLIKRGAYPFEVKAKRPDDLPSILLQVSLHEGEVYECSYHSHNGRIRRAPQVAVRVIKGHLTVAYGAMVVPLSAGEKGDFYSNLSPVLQCKQDSIIELTIYDEAFA